MPTLIEEIEQALAEAAGGNPAPVAGEVIAAETAAEEVAAAGVSITAVEFFPVVVILGMLAAVATWLRPTLKAQHTGHHNLLYRVVTWPARKLIHGIQVVEARVAHSMSHWLAPKTHFVAHWLHSITHEVHLLTQTLADLADNTHEALTWLRHHVLPHAILTALKPVVVAVEAVAADLNALEQRLQRAVDAAADTLEAAGVTVAHTMTAVLAALAALLVAVRAEVTHLVEVTVPAIERRLTAVEVAVTQTIPEAIGDLTARVKKLEDYIVSAAFIAVVVAAVSKAFDYLTCRNMKQLGTEACEAEETIVDTLLPLMFAAFALASLEELAKLAQSVESDAATLVKDALSA